MEGEINQSEKIVQEKTKKVKIIFLVVFILGVTIILFLFSSKKNNNLNKGPNFSINEKKENIKENNKFTTEKPYLKLYSSLSILKPNQVFSVEIKSDSLNQQIVGIDILIRFDKKKLKFLSANSLIKDFKVYSSEEDNILSLTFIQNLNSREKIYLTGETLAKIDFQALEVGKTQVEVVSDYKNRQSFFVNEKTEKIYPQLIDNNLLVEVKSD